LHKTIFAMTQKLVRQYGTRDPYELAESLGIEIMRSDRLKKLKGMYLYILRNPYIVINTNSSEILQKIVCAHELGHDRLHRKLASQGALQEITLFDMTARPEFEANLFAAELLMSDEEIISLQQQGFDAFQIASALESDINLVTLKISQLKKRGYPFDIDTSLYDRRFIN